MVIRKKVEGQIDYNDGEFAEVQTIHPREINSPHLDHWKAPRLDR